MITIRISRDVLEIHLVALTLLELAPGRISPILLDRRFVVIAKGGVVEERAEITIILTRGSPTPRPRTPNTGRTKGPSVEWNSVVMGIPRPKDLFLAQDISPQKYQPFLLKIQPFPYLWAPTHMSKWKERGLRMMQISLSWKSPGSPISSRARRKEEWREKAERR
jgi:hypothetical protein